MRHKWFVFLECWKRGLGGLGILHDLSKFSPDEFVPYARHFYGPDSSHSNGSHQARGRDETGYYKPTDTGDAAFDYAWLLHQKRNRHHWQWWILPEDSGGEIVLEMPWRYQKEMVADWRGAGRAQGTPDVQAWYAKNGHKMRLHPKTKISVELELGVYK